ncbi:fasciclin domain-containing protein [Deinococcus puniceus]
MTLSLLLATSAVAGGAGTPVARPATAASPAACKTIAQLVTSDPQFSTLAVAVEAAGLGDVLSSGAFTVFAPTNAAFAKVPSDMLATVLNDPEMLRSVLLYHVVPGKIAANQVVGLKSARTAQGSTIAVAVNGSNVMINDANVTKVNVAACNGVIHIIDTVLMPPMPAAATPAPEPVAETPAPEPVAETPAPEPVAETPAPEPVAEVAAPAPVFNISQIPATPLSGATTTTTTETATTETTTEAVTTTTTPEVTATAEATAECVVGSNTLYDVIVADDRFSTLRDLLSDAGLTETLMSGEYTVFAPTNDAFAAVDPDTLAIIASTPDLLRQVLLYHVVAGTVTAEKLAGGEVLKTAEGGDLTPGTRDGKQLIGIATVDVVSAAVGTTTSDPCNGVLYTIDQVLLPPNFTLPAPVVEAPAAEATTATTDTTATATTTTTTTTTTATVTTTSAVLAADARFSTLVSLLQAAGLVDTVNNGTFTVFAPTNEAFAKVPATTLASLQADPAKLRQVLLYHVVASSVDLVAAGAELTSAEGSLLPIVRADSTVKVAGGTVNTTAIMGGGTSKVYVIDTVLLPPSLR